jgi:hypothetical protein
MTRCAKFAFVLASVVSIALLTGTPPAIAQDAIARESGGRSAKPQSTVVVNGPDNPVPVMLITGVPGHSVTCFRNVTHPPNPSPTPFIGVSGTIATNLLECSSGASQIEVHRISFSPDVGPTPSSNVAGYRISIGFSSVNEPVNGSNFIALLSDAAPERTLSQPLRLDLGAGTWIPFTARCTSGLVGFDVRCGGLLMLQGILVE